MTIGVVDFLTVYGCFGGRVAMYRDEEDGRVCMLRKGFAFMLKIQVRLKMQISVFIDGGSICPTERSTISCMPFFTVTSLSKHVA